MRRLTTWACLGTLVACGARSALNVEPRDEETVVVPPTNQRPKDSAVAVDAKPDSGRDVNTPPRLDAASPPVDAFVKLDCDSPLTNFIYLVSDSDELYSYYPPSGSVRAVGTIQCPNATIPSLPSASHPFSMAVDRRGVAYVIFADGNLYRVSTKTAACAFTGYNTSGDLLTRFGMGFSANAGGAGSGVESLFVAGDESLGGGNGLASIDVVNNQQNFISPFQRWVGRMELTGSGDGRLFGFYGRTGQPGTFIGELDKRNATVVGEQAFPSLNFGHGWAFARYAGAFYMFTTTDSDTNSMATKFDPDTGVTQIVQTFPQTIVGAGVSTCAPDQ